MLWELINDEELFTFLSRDIQERVYQIFLNNINGFFETEKLTAKSLVNINKKYILLILNYIKNTYPNQPIKIKIHNELPVKELISYEEIHNDKKTKLDNEYNRRQEEFEDSMSIKIPNVPDFSDKQSDKPIKDMDKILKQMQIQRNYEVEQMNKLNTNITGQIDNWLKPQETTLKNENLKNQQNNSAQDLFEVNNESNLIKDKKNVSWDNTNEYINLQSNELQCNELKSNELQGNEDVEYNNIFSKFKKINETKLNDNIRLKIQDNKSLFSSSDDSRISILEKNIRELNEKMDKIINLLSNK